jgi:hypothetical protein
MIPSLIETPQRIPIAPRTREEVAQLLDALHEAYQSLSPSERSVVKNHIAREVRAQLKQEQSEEKKCFELAF